jgi:hypothetical protein
MKTTLRKSVAVIRKPVAMAALALCAAGLVCAGCSLFDFSVPWNVQQRMDRDGVVVFTDETDKVRAVIQSPPGDINQGLRCVDDNSIWKPDFRKTLDLAKGYASTRPVKVTTTLPRDWYDASLASRPVIGELPAVVLVDERGRVRAVAGTMGNMLYEIHPLNSTSVWRVDWLQTLAESYRAVTSAWFFTDDAGKDRAVIRCPLGEPNSAVHCLDDNSFWKPDFKKSLELDRGYVSTAPVQTITSLPTSLSGSLLAGKAHGLVLVDERGRVRGVLLLQKASEGDYEIHPVNTTSVWKLDWGQ